MAKRASGGARATASKHASEDAARRRKADFTKTWAQRFEELGDPPADLEHAHEWAARGMLLAFRQTLVDPGLRPEKRCSALAALAPQLAKLLDPAKLGAELREFKKAFEALKARKHGGEHAAGDPSGTATGASLS